MKNARFKVGDKVRILDGSKIKHFAGSWNNSMKQYVGETTEIIRTTDHYPYPEQIGYKVKGNSYTWDERSLAPACNETIVIYCEGNEVIALNKTTGKKAVAKCSPEDDFNFETGAKLAFERLVNPKKRVPMFKLGDKVRLKDDLVVGQNYGGLTLHDHMREQFPSIAIIRFVDSRDYTYQVEGLEFWFSEKMLELAPKTKFKVGDRVIGNTKANRYGLTNKGWRGKIIYIAIENNLIYVKDDFIGPFWVDSECFDLDTSPEYFNGKVVCIDSKSSYTTKGKIYEFKNGIGYFDDGDSMTENPVSSVDELHEHTSSRFIEVVE